MKTFASFLAAASMAATPLPAIAQPTADATQQDLRCAAWAAMISGDMGEDDDSWGAFAMMMTYFIGRYEGATGEDIGDAMTTDIVLSVAENLEAERKSAPA